MNKINLETEIFNTLKGSMRENNIHESVMDKIEKYEKRKLRRSYILELILSVVFILLSAGSLIVVRFYFNAYDSVLSTNMLNSVFKGVVLGIFYTILFILSLINIRLLFLFIREKTTN